jgi:spore germination protein GerM
MARRRPKLGKTGCLFWLFILLIIVVVLLYRGKGTLKESISSLKKRVAGERILEKKPSTAPIETVTSNSQEKKPDEKGPAQTPPEGKPSGKELEEGAGLKRELETDAQQKKTPTDEYARIEALKTEPLKKEKTTPEIKEKQLSTTIYYVKISKTDKTAKLYPLQKRVTYTDSPITRTIETLLEGPSEDERKQGITSFIPQGTSLISARFQNGHLTLNFSSQFEENYSGKDAINLQLFQIMFTVFELPQVNTLSILIDGEKKQYITGEGIPLKAVYTKQDLSL